MLQLTTIFFLISFSMLAGIHYIAGHLFLYWRLPWFDIPMHLFGGMVVALGFFALRDLRLFRDSFLRPVVVVALVLGVALIWELFEVVIGMPIDAGYVLDTGTDICMGLLGGYLGYFVGNSLRSLH